MDNTTNALGRTKLLVRIIGIVFILLGLASLISTSDKWHAENTLTLLCTLPVYLLMILGGGLLVTFRPDGLELIFIILRLNTFLGLITIVSGLQTKQLSTIIFGCGILVFAIGLMIFLSRHNVKSLFENKE